MARAAGTRIGPYEVVASLGEGGMGEVYRARDPRLDRDVAVKVLPPAAASDPDRLRRFAQEARAAGSLNHPSLVAVYDFGLDEGSPYLATELLEGETLRARLRRGPLAPRRAVELAAQVARGLAAAHDRGILHRDLKPENLFLTRDGRAKLLDFGLAKLSRPESGEAAAATVTLAAGEAAGAPTAPGTVLGTAAYMAPEQARGEEADERSDLFAFGVVLFEMLAGANPFRRASPVETLHAILHEDPPELAALQPGLPPALERIVERCLAKDPEARFRSAHDLGFALEALSGASGASDPAGAAAAANGRRRPRLGLTPSRVLPWALVAAALVLAAGLALRGGRPAEAPPLHVEIVPPPLTPRTLGVALSPDGSQLALAAPAERGGRNLLWVRALAGGAFQPLAFTEQADAAYPFWSPDSRSLAFFSEGRLKKVRAAGGPVQTLCEAPAGRGGTWARDGTILFAPTGTSALYRVPADGGVAVAVTRLERSQDSHRWPSFLPDGRHFVFLDWSSEGGRKVERVVVGDLDLPEVRFLLDDASDALFAPPGHLLFVRDGRLLAQRFDPEALVISGETVPVTDETVTLDRERGYGVFSLSAGGALAYRAQGPPLAELAWLDRQGRRLGTLGEAAAWGTPRLSPDGGRVAAVRQEADGRGDLWVLDVARGNATRLTFQPAQYWAPVWSPDGRRLAFTSDAAGSPSIYLETLGASVEPQRLFASETNDYVESWSGDGAVLLFDHQDPKTLNDLWLLPLADPRAARALLQAPFREEQGVLSPDGRWLAYVSWESGQSEVYVRPFPAVDGGKWQLSAHGGNGPRWRADGRELYFASPDARVMAVAVGSGPDFAAGPAQALFAVPEGALEGGLELAAAADGQRFLVRIPLARQAAPLTLLLPWDAALRGEAGRGE